MSITTKFNGLNFKDFAPEFTVHCLQRGAPGFSLMKRYLTEATCTDDDHRSISGGDSSPSSDFNSEEFHRNKQLLFYDLMNSFTPTARKQLQDRLGDGMTKICLSLDCFELWDQMENMSLWFKDHSTPPTSSHIELSTMKALSSIIKGDYIRTSWLRNTSPSDLRSDIVNVSSNQALICALVLTIALPLFIDSASFENMDNNLSQFYTLFLGVATCTEAAAVLVCLRNVLAVKLVEEHNIHQFTALAHSALLIPNKLNVLAVLSLISGLLSYGYLKFGAYRFFFFLVVVALPSAATTNFHIALGIKSLYAVQPWNDSSKSHITKNCITKQDIELTSVHESGTKV
jgi:hypothetical protein